MASSSIAEQLAQLPDGVQKLLEQHHFDAARFERLAGRLRNGPVDHAAANRVQGRVEPPAAGDVSDLPEAGSAEWLRLEAKGLEALRKGECALVVLAGGMATRMGGVVKALVEALPGRTFLDLRLAEMQALEKRVGRRVPLWLMSSHATDAALREALGDRIDGQHIAVFPQSLSLRVTPDGDLFHDSRGQVSEHAPGHGDLPDALRESGLLARFVQDGGRVLMMANLDNLGRHRRPGAARLAPRPADPGDLRSGRQGRVGPRRHSGARRRAARGAGGVPPTRGLRPGPGAGVQHQHVPLRRPRSR